MRVPLSVWVAVKSAAIAAVMAVPPASLSILSTIPAKGKGTQPQHQDGPQTHLARFVNLVTSSPCTPLSTTSAPSKPPPAGVPSSTTSKPDRATTPSSAAKPPPWNSSPSTSTTSSAAHSENPKPRPYTSADPHSPASTGPQSPTRTSRSTRTSPDSNCPPSKPVYVSAGSTSPCCGTRDRSRCASPTGGRPGPARRSPRPRNERGGQDSARRRHEEAPNPVREGGFDLSRPGDREFTLAAPQRQPLDSSESTVEVAGGAFADEDAPVLHGGDALVCGMQSAGERHAGEHVVGVAFAGRFGESERAEEEFGVAAVRLHDRWFLVADGLHPEWVVGAGVGHGAAGERGPQVGAAVVGGA